MNICSNQINKTFNHLQYESKPCYFMYLKFERNRNSCWKNSGISNCLKFMYHIYYIQGSRYLRYYKYWAIIQKMRVCTTLTFCYGDILYSGQGGGGEGMLENCSIPGLDLYIWVSNPSQVLCLHLILWSLQLMDASEYKVQTHWRAL